MPKGSSTSRTHSIIRVCLPSWLGLLLWKCSLETEIPSRTAALHRPASVYSSISTQRKHLHFQAPQNPLAKLFWKPSPWVRYIKSNSFKTPVPRRWPNPCKPLSLVTMPGAREEGASIAQSVQTATAACGLCGRHKVSKAFCWEGKHHSQKETACLIFNIYYIIEYLGSIYCTHSLLNTLLFGKTVYQSKSLDHVYCKGFLTPGYLRKKTHMKCTTEKKWRSHLHSHVFLLSSKYKHINIKT